MSRGLGLRQRQVLAALLRLETAHGEGGFRVHHVLNPMGKNGLTAEREAQRQASLEADRQREAAAVAKAVLGDPEAAKEVELWKRLRALGSVLRRRPGPNRRRSWHADEDLNPSRVFALLEKRGLVWRYAAQEPGAVVGLTDEARAAA